MKAYNLEYNVNGTAHLGYMVEPHSQGAKLPGIIMYTDFWGVNARQKKVAEKLSNMGAVVFIADMYGNQECGKDFEDSTRLMNLVTKDDKSFKNKILTPYELLKKQPMVNQDKLFSIGYCFGGVSSLQLARFGEGLCGAISIHGILSSAIRVPSTKKMPKMLILHGAKDPLVPENSIKEFYTEMIACNADFTFISYGNCTHAFSNDEAAGNEVTAYSYIADKRSDVYIKSFLCENF